MRWKELCGETGGGISSDRGENWGTIGRAIVSVGRRVCVGLLFVEVAVFGREGEYAGTRRAYWD